MVLAVSSGVLSERSPSFFRHVLCLLEQFTTGKGSFVHRNRRYTEIRSEHSDRSSKPGSIAAEECPQVSLMQQQADSPGAEHGSGSPSPWLGFPQALWRSRHR